MYKAAIEPHWFHGDTRFWYRNELAGGTSEFIVVDTATGQRGPAFDHTQLAAALSAAAGSEFPADRLPFTTLEFIEQATAIRFEAAGRTWKYVLESHACTPSDPGAPAAAPAGPGEAEPRRRRRRAAPPDGEGEPARETSPDGRWTAVVRDHNLFLKSADPGAAEIQLSHDGSEHQSYGLPAWSPDSTTVVAWRITPAEEKEVHVIESAPKDGGRAKLTSRPYALPGDPFPVYELNLYDVATRKQTRPAVDR